MYNDLTINQKISLKGILTNKKERKKLGVDEDGFDGYEWARLFYPWDVVINFFLSADINVFYEYDNKTACH